MVSIEATRFQEPSCRFQTSGTSFRELWASTCSWRRSTPHLRFQTIVFSKHSCRTSLASHLMHSADLHNARSVDTHTHTRLLAMYTSWNSVRAVTCNITARTQAAVPWTRVLRSTFEYLRIRSQPLGRTSPRKWKSSKTNARLPCTRARVKEYSWYVK